MSKQPPDYPVLIPYSKLCELLEASEQIVKLRQEINQYKKEVLALRIIQQECIERIGELKKLI